MIENSLTLYIFTFIGTFVLTLLAERLLIPLLKKCAKQPIYEEGPAWHKSKSGTPTMGGLAFIIGIGITLVVCALFLSQSGLTGEALSLLSCLVYSFLNSGVGILDDYFKLQKREHKGLSPWQKLIFQSLLAIAFLCFRYFVVKD